ncbi:NACHT domain-containing protein [Chloroflexi bacterium TSY]|nr:NACHT domain-containing protein [Chloroflexi bacterium TSY]
MLQLVKSTWVEGVLERSLHNAVLIDLNLETRSGVVDYPWDMIIRIPDQADRPFPQGTKIPDVFAKMNQSLLILGEPGSGKTTMLLELARDLITRAEVDYTLPIPVVFNLSSWSEKRKLITEWLVDEFNSKYSIPKKVAQSWVANDEILLLLDGLDEVKPEYREECIKAINAFRQNHLVPMAVCSRTAEYEALTNQLKLQGAVILKPLTSQQIDDYLTGAGRKLTAMGDMLQQDTTLRELAQSPLLLSIMTLAYHTIPVAEIEVLDSIEARRRHLFNAYINKMFARTARTLTVLYPKEQTIRWLQWLASRLMEHGQTLFLIEQMQPNWAHSTNRSRFMIAAAMLMWGPIYGLLGGLLVGLSDALILGLNDGLSDGLILGLSEGFSGRFQEIKLSDQLRVSWRKLRSSLYSALVWGLSFGLIGGLIAGLIGGLIGGTVGGIREVQFMYPFEFSWEKIRTNLFSGLLVGLIVGLSFGLLVGLIQGLIGGLSSELSSGLSGGLLEGLSGRLIEGLSGGLIFGLLVGLIFGLIFEPSVTVDIPNTLATQAPNQGIKLSAKYALATGLIFGLSGGLISGLSLGLSGGLTKGLSDGLSLGLIGGLSDGVIGGGDVVTKHCILRLILWRQGNSPLNYARFLDYCHDRIFLRKVGGGYVFIHRMLLEHFAQFDKKDIQSLFTEK